MQIVKLLGTNRFVHVQMVTLVHHKLTVNCVSNKKLENFSDAWSSKIFDQFIIFVLCLRFENCWGEQQSYLRKENWIECTTTFKNILTAIQPECRSDPECDSHLACVREECVDPCYTSACGQNAHCKARNHRAVCICNPGFEGNPYAYCEERKEP